MRSSPRKQSKSPWRLSDYLPYHLSFTAELMSMEQSKLLFEATGLAMTEWRVMAVIGSFQPLSTRTVVSYTTMNKVAVSRAVSSLVERGYVTRDIDEQDSRLLRLGFTEEGKRMFKRVTEMASEWAATIFDSMSDEEIALLKHLLGKVRNRIREVAGDDGPVNEKQLFGDT